MPRWSFGQLNDSNALKLFGRNLWDSRQVDKSAMSLRVLSILGILIAVSCLMSATMLYPGGFDWSRDYISTLVRGPAGLARDLADAGVLLFCVSLAMVFERLACTAEFSKVSKVIRIGGIGAMVYAGLTITSMHDLMVSISLVFLLAALLALARALYAAGETVFFVSGCLCLALFVASATVYYTGFFVTVLPWAQRVSFGLLTIWLVALDYSFPRNPAAINIRTIGTSV